MFCESSWFWKATPITSPSALRAGPPLLPGLMAASICTASRLAPEWAYRWISMRETTPCVTETPSPPSGYPTTETSSCSDGIGPNSSGSTPSQKASSDTVRVARSHSCAMRATCATCFCESPALRTSTYVASATQWAFVRMTSWPSCCCRIVKPEPVLSSCGLLLHGMATLTEQCTEYTLTTGSAVDADASSGASTARP